MEACGEPLSATIARGPSGDRIVRRVAARLLGALACLRRVAIIHADVKPDNVLRDEDGDVTLIDFGNAIRPREARGGNQTSRCRQDGIRGAGRGTAAGARRGYSEGNRSGRRSTAVYDRAEEAWGQSGQSVDGSRRRRGEDVDSPWTGR